MPQPRSRRHARVLFEDALMAAQEDLRAARALVDAGREADLRAVQAQAATAAAGADLEAAKASAQNAFAQLASLAGVPRPYTSVDSSLLPLVGNLRPPSAEPPTVTPAIASALAEREAAARRVTVERTRAVPDVTALLGIRRLAGDNATAFVAACPCRCRYSTKTAATLPRRWHNWMRLRRG